MVWAKTEILYLLFNSVCVSLKIFGYPVKYFNKTLALISIYTIHPVNIYLESLKTSSFDGSFPLIFKSNSHQKEDSFIDEKLSKCLSCHKSINKCIFPSSFFVTIFSSRLAIKTGNIILGKWCLKWSQWSTDKSLAWTDWYPGTTTDLMTSWLVI